MSAPGWRLPTPRPGGPTYPPLIPALHPGLLLPGPCDPPACCPGRGPDSPEPLAAAYLLFLYRLQPVSAGLGGAPPRHVLRAQAHLHWERAARAHARSPTPQLSHTGSRKVTVRGRALGSLLGPPCLCPRRPRPPHWHPRDRARSALRCKWGELGRVGLGGESGGSGGRLHPTSRGTPAGRAGYARGVISSGCVWPFSPAPTPPKLGIWGAAQIWRVPKFGGLCRAGYARAG